MRKVGNLHLEQGIALKNEGDWHQALEEFRAAVAEEPESAEAHHQLGLALGFIGEFDESLEVLTKAAAMDNTSVPTLIDLAKTQAMLGMYEEAKTGFDEVLRLDPGNEVARQNLKYLV